jgi:uncharacterized spore protein YtfJ
MVGVGADAPRVVGEFAQLMNKEIPVMEQVKDLIHLLSAQLKRVAAANAVIAKPVSVGDRHILPLCELGVTFGGGGGGGEGTGKDGHGQGLGAAAGGGAKASPIAVLVIEAGKVRLDKIGR